MENKKSNVVRIEKGERRQLPNKAFDMEYQTERYREVQFLASKGIQYTFVKKTRDYGISQYKYEKTPALFAALVEFYSMLEAEKRVNEKKVVPMRKDKKAENKAEPAVEVAAESKVKTAAKSEQEIPAEAVTQDDTE